MKSLQFSQVLVTILVNSLLSKAMFCQAASISSSSSITSPHPSKLESSNLSLKSSGKTPTVASAATLIVPQATSNNDQPIQSNLAAKTKRETTLSATEHLDTQETLDYHHLTPPVHHHSSYQAPATTAESDYGYDSGKNAYGKQASDWSLYDQGNHGIYDKYGDKAWKDHGHNDHSAHGKHDSYGNSYNSHGAGHGSGYYSRDRGYGYEKHYAYDKEVASKHHSDSHNNYGSQHGLHDHYGNSASQAHTNAGHDKYGQASRYGNHGYGKRGSNLAAHHDYGHNANKGHYYSSQAAPLPPPVHSNNYHSSSYSSHVPTYRSTYSDYGPQIGYPSSYPSYY